jgi:hypothetical protein
MRAAPGISRAGAWIVTMAWALSASADAQSAWTARVDVRDPDLAGLTKALLSNDGWERQKAISALGQLPTVPPSAWPSLRKAFGTEDMELRTSVAIPLGQAGDGSDATVGALLEALEFQPRRHDQALRALEASGAVLASIARSVCLGFCPAYSVHVLKDGMVVYQGYAHVKVEGFAGRPLTPRELEALVGAFQEADFLSLADEYRARATDAPSVDLRLSREGRTKRVVHDLSNPGPEALQRLEQRFDEIVASQEWVGTRQQAASTTRRRREDVAAGHVPLSILRAWRTRLEDPRVRVRRLAARELYQPAERVPEPERSEWQLAASRVLGEALGDRDESQRYAAITALQGTGPLPPEVVEALVKDLDDPSARVRHGVYDRLYWVGPAGAVAVPVLLERVGRPHSSEWHFAATALGRIGAAAKPGVPALVRGLRTGGESDRLAAAQALGWIGPAASAAVPALEAALSDRNPRVRKAAAEALQAIRLR